MSDTNPQDIIRQTLATMAEGDPVPRSLIEWIRRLGQQHGAWRATDAVRIVLVIQPASRETLGVGADLLFGQATNLLSGQTTDLSGQTTDLLSGWGTNRQMGH